MAAILKDTHESEDEIPEAHRELFSERNGKWVFDGVKGIKSQGDVDRVQRSLETEREDHKQTKKKLKSWTDLGEFDDVTGKLDRFPALEAAADGKLDDDKIQELAQKIADAKVNVETAPLKREKKQLADRVAELEAENKDHVSYRRGRELQDEVMPLVAKSVIPEHHEDALMYAERHLERVEDSDGNVQFVSRDGVGVTPGLDGKLWLEEMLEKKPGWLPASQGSGAPGSRPGSSGGANPWTRENWNVTKQGQVLREHGPEKAEKLASAAGTTVGGGMPEAKK